MITRFLLTWLRKFWQSPTALSLTLLWLGLGSLALTLEELQPGLIGRHWALLIGGASLLAWRLAAAKNWPGWLAALLLLGLGFELSLLLVGDFISPLRHLAQAALLIAGQALRQPWSLDGQLLAALLEPMQQIWQGVLSILQQQGVWLTNLLQGTPRSDLTAGSATWYLLLWLAAGWAGWATRRREQPLPAMLPAGAMLSTVLAYHPSHAGRIIPLALATLLLLGVNHYRRLEQHWQAANIDHATTLRTEMMMAVFSLAAILTLLAAVTPSLSVWKLARMIEERLQSPLVSDSAADSGSGSPGLDNQTRRTLTSTPNPLTPFRAAGLPRSHLLGSGPELTERPVMQIRLQPPPGRPAPRYYWRGRSYDGYSGRGWFTGPTVQVSYQAGILTDDEPNGGQLIEQRVTRVDDDRRSPLLHVTGELLTAQQPFHINRRSRHDIFAATQATAGSRPTRSYTLTVRLPQADEAGLQRSGNAYPADIRARYLSLPPKTPERVLTLAGRLTAAAPTPYDRAKAIETHLRQFPYNLDLPAPPPGRDIVDYFLFDLQQGYCDYYASSMVILARAAGLPARLAVGYTSGSYYPDGGYYLVTEANAHSWPEIYFPDHGWIVFEPTAAQPASGGSQPAPLAEESDKTDEPASDWLNQHWLQAWGPTVGAMTTGLLLIGLGYFGYWAMQRRRLRRQAPAVVIVTLYQQMVQRGAALHPTGALPEGLTAYEFAETLAATLSRLGENRRGQKTLQTARPDIEQLTRLYVQTAFSSRPPTAADKQAALQSWRRLRPRLWLARLMNASNRRRAKITFSFPTR